MNTSKVKTVIVNWERPHDTIECIHSLVSAQIPEPQILIVDNGSQDDSIIQIREAFPEVSFYSLPQNLGFAGGYNFGIEQALASDATHIFLLNNDTVVDPSAIEMLLNTSWDVAVPKILFYDKPALVWSVGARWRVFPPAVIMLGLNRPDGPAFDKPFPLDFATGCALMVQRKVLETIGGFDPTFENYMEDYDFSYRVRESGFSMGYVPEARILHKVSQTLGVASPRFWWYLGRNTVLFYRKQNRFSIWKLWSVMAWVLVREIVKGQARYLLHYFKGAQDGFSLIEQQEAYKKNTINKI